MFLCTALELEDKKCVLYCLCRSKTNFLRLNNLTIEKTIKTKLLRFVIYIEAIVYPCDSFINFIGVAVFINCSSS